MSTNTIQAKLICPYCERKIRFKTIPSLGTSFRCPGCQGHIIYTTDSNLGSNTYDLAPETPRPSAPAESCPSRRHNTVLCA